MVELQDPPASRVVARARQAAQGAAQAEAAGEAHVAQLKAAQAGIIPQLTASDVGATVLFQAQRSYNGIAVTVDPNQAAKMFSMPGVKDVHPLIPKTRTAPNSINFLGTPSFWNAVASGGLNLHGENIKIAVLDSGIDYLHTDFGGTGTGYDTLNSTTIPGNGIFPNSRVKGGYDFAGDAYTGSNAPQPDPNPFDCNPNPNPSFPADPRAIGHGTLAAGIAGGSGVNADGTTYAGPYNGTAPLRDLRVPPGIAPAADLYALRVFGCQGNTQLVIPALEWCLDPAHRMDVISASLGGGAAPADDPEAVAASNAAAQGVITVFAANNSGDIYYSVGAPASGTGTIAVAASYNDQGVIPTVQVNQPFSSTDIAYLSFFGPKPPAEGLTGRVVAAQPAVADGPLTNAAAVAGNLCLVDRGNTEAATFGKQVLNAQNAGAIAVIIANDDSPDGSPGDNPAVTAAITIPSALISQADGNAIKAVVTPDADSPVNATLNLYGPNVADWIPSYTSRGPRRNDSVLKPDVTAPAEVVVTAANGSGTGAEPFSGTSSSTPHVAGAMALMKQLHPTWTVEQLKALVMNTADFDLFSRPGRTGPKVGPGRIGAGRMDLATAAKANVVAYTAARPLGVSVSYGAVDVPVAIGNGTYSLPQFVNVVNKGATPVTYAVSFTSVGTDVPGVTFTVPGTVAVPPALGGADGRTTFPVTLNAIPNQMRHTHDPSITPTALGTTRQWLAEATGYVVLTPDDGSPTLRLVVHAAPRPTSDVRATATTLGLPAASGTVSLDLVGSGIDTGGSNPSYPTDILSLGKTLELQYVSPADVPGNVGAASADLKHVGVASDYAAEGNDLTRTVLSFGVATYGDHAAPDNANARIDIVVDTSLTGDFSPKYVVTHSPIGPNIYVPFILNVATGTTTYDWYLNVYPDLDTNIFNNSVLLFPVNATSLGLTAANTRFRYQVLASYNGALIDQSPVLTYDPATPGLVETPAAGEPFLDSDAAGTLTFDYNAANLAANRSRGLMVMHFHNAAGARSEAVLTNAPKLTSFAPASGSVGATVVLTGQGFTGATAVKFFNDVPATSFTVNSDTQITATVPAGAATGLLRVETPAGAATSRTKFGVVLP